MDEENIPTVLWIIITILRGENGRADSRHRSLAITHIEDAIYRLYADQQEKADQKEREGQAVDTSLLTPAELPKRDPMQPINPRRPQGMA